MQMNLMTLLLEACQTTLLRVNEQAEVVTRQTIVDAMEQCILDNGQISRRQIVTILDEFRAGIMDDVQQQIDLIQAHPGLVRPQGPHNGAGAGRIIGAGKQEGGTLYAYPVTSGMSQSPSRLQPASSVMLFGSRLWKKITAE